MLDRFLETILCTRKKKPHKYSDRILNKGKSHLILIHIQFLFVITISCSDSLKKLSLEVLDEDLISSLSYQDCESDCVD